MARVFAFSASPGEQIFLLFFWKKRPLIVDRAWTAAVLAAVLLWTERGQGRGVHDKAWPVGWCGWNEIAEGALREKKIVCVKKREKG